MREHAAHAHADKIALLAVIPDPLFELRLVGPLDHAAVDVLALPPVPKAPEALPKPSGVPGRVAEGEPDDFGVLVGERAFGDLPNPVADCRGLVENHDDAPPLVMEPGKGLGVFFTPRDRIGAPQPLALR